MAIESFSSIKREIITKGKKLTVCLGTLALSFSLLVGCGESVGGQDPSEQKPSTTASENVGGQGGQDPSEQNPPTTASEGVKPADSSDVGQGSQTEGSSSSEGFVFHNKFEPTYVRIINPADNPSEGVKIYNNRHGKSAEVCYQGDFYTFSPLDNAIGQIPSYSESDSSRCTSGEGVYVPSLNDLPGSEAHEDFTVRYCLNIPDEDGTEVFSTFSGEYEKADSIDVTVLNYRGGRNVSENPRITVWHGTCEERFPQ